MSFRRSAKAVDSDSSRWRRANRSRLVLCGIPAEVADCHRRWLYVLDHEFDPETGWRVNWLSPGRAAELAGAMARDPASLAGSGHFFMVALRQRAGSAGVEFQRPGVFGQQAA